MSRRSKRVAVNLQPGDFASLPPDDIRAILRAADDIIFSGGRSLLVKILKGSKDKKLLGMKLDESPVYGYYQDLTLAEVQERVDWMIDRSYLAIDYDGKLPLIVYTAKGWAIEMETITDEIISEFDVHLASEERPYDMTYLKDRNREMILRLIERIEATGNSRYIPILEDWAAIDYKKIRKRLNQAIRKLKEE